MYFRLFNANTIKTKRGHWTLDMEWRTWTCSCVLWPNSIESAAAIYSVRVFFQTMPVWEPSESRSKWGSIYSKVVWPGAFENWPKAAKFRIVWTISEKSVKKVLVTSLNIEINWWVDSKHGFASKLPMNRETREVLSERIE